VRAVELLVGNQRIGNELTDFTFSLGLNLSELEATLKQDLTTGVYNAVASGKAFDSKLSSVNRWRKPHPPRSLPTGQVESGAD
jgi:hypothetical protein